MKTTSLISFAISFMIVGQAIGAWWWPPSNIEIFPQDPTSCDIVVITLSGGWGNSCIPNASAILVDGNDIYFDVTWDYSPGFCLDVLTPWELTRSVGPLAPGTYYIYARLFEYSQIPGEYELIAEFTVTAESCVPTVYYVGAANGNDLNDGLTPETAFVTIQKGIDTAKSGDTIIVAPGVYIGNGNHDIDFYCKAITVRSVDPTDSDIVASTIVDCNGAGYGFHFRSNEGPNSVLAGFTITNGFGGIYCRDYSGPTIRDCIITNNRASYYATGIWCDNSSPKIINCTVSGHSAGYGHGIATYNSSLTITNCIITENSSDHGGGIYCIGDSSLTIANCIISRNSATFYGGGIFVGGSNAVISNCIISDNVANWGGGGLSSSGSNMTITNCTFAANSSGNGNAVRCSSSHNNPSDANISNCIFWDGGDEISNTDGSTITIIYSDVQGGWVGLGNIDADPCFVEPGYWDTDSVWVDGDYHLLRTSPCIDAANDANVYTDIEGNIRPFDFPGVDNNGELPEFDMGAYEAMVSCFGVNHVKLETKAGKKGNKVELKGTFSPALPINFARDDVIYIIDDGQGHMLGFIIPAGSFEPEGEPEKQKFKFDSPKHSQPDIKAKFDFLKCKFELKVKGVMDTSEISGETLAIVLQAGENPANLVEEVVQVEVKPKQLEYKREPKLSCCPKCKGIALLEVTSTDPFTGDEYVLLFEPEPGKEKLKRKTVVDDGVNGRVKIDTSCSKPLEVGDVFGAYTVTDLIKIFDDDE